MGGLPIFGNTFSANPIVRAKQEQDMLQRALRGLHGMGKPALPTPFNFAQTGMPTQPQAPAPQPAPAGPPPPPPKPAVPAGSTPQTAPDTHTLLQQDLLHQLQPGGGPPMPTYTAPKLQTEDPRQLLIEGLGMLFTHGGASSAIAGGIGARQAQYAQQYQQDVDQSENAYNRAMNAYDRDVAARETRIGHDITGMDAIDKEAETAREHRTHDAAVQRTLDIKARQVSDQKSEAADRLRVSLYETAQRLGVEKSRVGEAYWAQAQRDAVSLQNAGLHAQTALNVAQLGATSRFVQAMYLGQNRKEIAQLQQSGMWDRLQVLQQNENMRGAMTQIGLLVRQANNPKNPGAKAAAAQLEQAMGDPSSPIGQLMQQFQGMGLMAAPVGDVMQEEIDAETPLPGETAGYQMGGGFLAQPAPPTTVNVQAPAQGGTPGTNLPASSDFQAWMKWVFGGQHPAAAAGGGQPIPNHTHAAANTADNPLMGHLQDAQRFLYTAQHAAGKSPEEAWAALKSSISGASPQQIEQFRQALFGTGASHPKNLTSLPLSP